MSQASLRYAQALSFERIQIGDMQMKLRHWVIVGSTFISACALAGGNKEQRTQGEPQSQRSSAAASQQQSQAQAGAQSGQAGAAQSDERVRQAQQQLNQLGYDVGPVDGILGPQTQSALRDFQQDKGLQASGQLDSQTLAALQSGERGAAGPSGPSGKAGQSGSSSMQSGSSSMSAPSSQSSGSSSQSSESQPSTTKTQ